MTLGQAQSFSAFNMFPHNRVVHESKKIVQFDIPGPGFQ